MYGYTPPETPKNSAEQRFRVHLNLVFSGATVGIGTVCQKALNQLGISAQASVCYFTDKGVHRVYRLLRMKWKMENDMETGRVFRVKFLSSTKVNLQWKLLLSSEKIPHQPEQFFPYGCFPK